MKILFIIVHHASEDAGTRETRQSSQETDNLLASSAVEDQQHLLLPAQAVHNLQRQTQTHTHKERGKTGNTHRKIQREKRNCLFDK